MHDRDADVALPRILGARIGDCGVTARQRADARFAPELERRALAVFDIEPEKEAAFGPVEAQMPGEIMFGYIEFSAIERAHFFDMTLFVPERDRRFLNRQRYLRRGVGTQMRETLDQM